MDEMTRLLNEALPVYPSKEQVNAWAAEQLLRSENVSVTGEPVDYTPIRLPFGNSPNTLVNRYVRFTAGDGRRPFYGYWQPALNTPAPLLINLPGYGSSITMHPQISDLGYNILHISPLGYVTPEKACEELALSDGNWPVLYNTAAGIPGGYEDWISDCLLAVRWAQEQPEVLPDRLSFFGTSQGGGGSLLMASILGPKRVRCVCADLPFLTNFPRSGLEGDAYQILRPAYDTVPHSDFWARLGYIDTMSHAHRLTMPVMLSAGGADRTCPPITIEALFQRLPSTKQYTYLEHQVHTHSRSSIYLFSAWLRMYA